MLLLANCLAPFGEVENAQILDMLFIWNLGKDSGNLYNYGWAIVTRPELPEEEYRDYIREGELDSFSAHGKVTRHDRTLPVWSLVGKIMAQINMNEPRLQWHPDRKCL